MSQNNCHWTVAHGPKLALRSVTSHLVTDMCIYSHAIVGVSPHDYGRAIVGYIICPTHTVRMGLELITGTGAKMAAFIVARELRATFINTLSSTTCH
jgi:hypothetical protein